MNWNYVCGKLLDYLFLCWVSLPPGGHLLLPAGNSTIPSISGQKSVPPVCHTYKSMCHYCATLINPCATLFCVVYLMVNSPYIIVENYLFCGAQLIKIVWHNFQCCTSNSVAHFFWKQCATLLLSSVPLCVFLMCTISAV